MIHPGLLCAFCRHPATTIAYAFAVCDRTHDLAEPCMERARELFRLNLREAAVTGPRPGR